MTNYQYEEKSKSLKNKETTLCLRIEAFEKSLELYKIFDGFRTDESTEIRLNKAKKELENLRNSFPDFLI